MKRRNLLKKCCNWRTVAKSALIASAISIGTEHARSDVEFPDNIGKEQYQISQGTQVPDGAYEAVGAIGSTSHCSGTLIDDQTVLTAAHCVEDGAPVLFTFTNVFPVDDPATAVDESLTRVDVRMSGTAYHHPQYVPPSPNVNICVDHDLAIVMLEEPASLRIKGIKPIQITGSSPGFRTGDTLTLIGFGHTGTLHNNRNPNLRECPGARGTKRMLNLKVRSNNNESFDFSKKAFHVCGADSGGPALNSQGKLVGVAWCGDRREWSAHTTVWSSFDWIRQFIGRGEVYVSSSDGKNFADTFVAQEDIGYADQPCLVGDFNGDGLTDLLAIRRSTMFDKTHAKVDVALNMGNRRFALRRKWHENFSLDGEVPIVGDFNGDGKDDIATFLQDKWSNMGRRGWVYVALSDGVRFSDVRPWHNNFSLGGEVPVVGDFNGDGKDDIATFLLSDRAGNGKERAWVYVALSDGKQFVDTRPWHNNFSLGGEVPAVGDFNGDGKDDIVTFLQDDRSNAGEQRGWVYVALSDGSRFVNTKPWHNNFSLGGEIPATGDINGDGKDDIVTFLQDDVAGQAKERGWVYVALSDGGRFNDTRAWHKKMSVSSREVPTVGQFHISPSAPAAMDILTFTR